MSIVYGPFSGKKLRYFLLTDYSKVNSRWIYYLIIETIKRV